MDPGFNFDVSSVVSVLAFMGTGALGVAAAMTAAYLLHRGNGYAAGRVLLAALGLAGVYGAALLGLSANSREHRVAPGELKYFCELDCHLAYSVAGRSRETVRDAGSTARARETVELRVWFDPTTTSARRGDDLLHPNPRSVRLVDEDGRRYAPAEQSGTLSLAGTERWAPLTHPLRPGESYRTRLVFDLPADARPTRLLLTEADPVTRLLIGHENSLLHAKTIFELPAEGGRSAVR